MPPALRERVLHQERDDRLATLVPRLKRRHRPGGVFGEEGDETVDVGALHGVRVGRDELAGASISE
jgi:hypothetical protein